MAIMHHIYSLPLVAVKAIEEKLQYPILSLSLLASMCLRATVWTAVRMSVGRGLQCFDKTLGSGGSLASIVTCTGLSWLSVPVRTIWYVGASGSSLTHPRPSGQLAVYVNGNRYLPCPRSFQVPWMVCPPSPGWIPPLPLETVYVMVVKVRVVPCVSWRTRIKE